MNTMPQSLRRCLVILTATAIAMAALLAFLPAAGHDQLWFLLMARRWLDGAQLYGPEIFDSNPPLIVWVSAVPVAIAHPLGIPSTLVAKTLIIVLYAAVAEFLRRLLPCTWRILQPGEPWALLFAFVILTCVLPARDLGQRDALAGVLVLPYVLSASPGARSGLWKELVAVLLAALACCLKPQDSLVVVAVELFSLWRAWKAGRASRAEPANFHDPRWKCFRSRIPVLLLSGGLYVLTIQHFAPLYFSNALPILRNSYWAIGHLSLSSLGVEAIELLVLILITTFTLWRSNVVSPVTWSLFAGGWGALAAYLIQGTGWYYQQLPALGLFGGALTLQLLDGLRLRPVRLPGALVRITGSLCVLAVVLTTHFMGYPFTTDRAFDLTSPNPAFFEHLAPGTPVAILTTSVDEAMMPIERFHLTWAQRTNNLWLLPAILRSEALRTADPRRRLTPLELARLRDTQQRWMVEDLQRWHPQLVLIERCQDPAVHCQVLEDRHDNLLTWFSRDPKFRQEWQNYRFTETRDRFDAYVLQPASAKH